MMLPADLSAGVVLLEAKNRWNSGPETAILSGCSRLSGQLRRVFRFEPPSKLKVSWTSA
jgi:hypothetical protein